MRNNRMRQIGVATPQANPTVEHELQRMMRGDVRPVFTRLTSSADSQSDRLIDYASQLADAIATFSSMPLEAFAFACTGSSYLVGLNREQEIVNAAEQEHRVQVLTATQAIRRELEGRGAHRIAVLAPYPESLLLAAVEYWQQVGFDVVAHKSLEVGQDARAIYSLSTDDVLQALRDFDVADADLILMSGTGMPTLHAMRQFDGAVLSSNLCLATECLRRVHEWPANQAADIQRLMAGGR